MKHLLNIQSLKTMLLLVAVVALSSHRAANVDYTFSKDGLKETSEINLSRYKKRKYRKDATRLALRLLSTSRDYTDLNAEAPKEDVESIYNALVAVHMSGLEKSKEVTEAHKLHTFPIPSVDKFFVVYKRSAEWAKPLRLGDHFTDNEEINELNEKYGLIIDKHVEWDEEHNSFNIKATKSLNIAPIANSFSNIEDVVLVDLLTPDGDGNDIEVRRLKNGWMLNYMVKFDSCITGCKKKHIWTFEVSDSQQVKFISESGDELPDWMKGVK